MEWPTAKEDLLILAKSRLLEFCLLNSLPLPPIVLIEKSDWHFSVCAYYRPKTGINICLEKCQQPCGEAESRNWTWPGSTTDRSPYGVVAHELGHHADWTASNKKGAYYGDYSINLRGLSGEKPITSYCENDAEWFAEIFRLFVTNPDLLSKTRPKTYNLLLNRWVPVKGEWLDVLGTNVPKRVIRTLNNKTK